MASEKDDKRKRRDKGEGGIHWQASRQMWAGVVDLGWKDGKRRRKYV